MRTYARYRNWGRDIEEVPPRFDLSDGTVVQPNCPNSPLRYADRAPHLSGGNNTVDGEQIRCDYCGAQLVSQLDDQGFSEYWVSVTGHYVIKEDWW